MWGRHELLEREGRRRGWRGLWVQCPHELLVALAGFKGCTALCQGSEGTGTTLCLCPSQPEESQGHLPGGDREREGGGGGELTLRGSSTVRVWGQVGWWEVA